MKLPSLLLLVACVTALGETEERIQKQFTIQSGGTLVVDVDFGSLDVKAHDAGEVVVDVLRKVTRATKAEEEEFLADRPVTITPEGDTVTIQSHATSRDKPSGRGNQRTEAKYTITVPAKFNTQLKTAAGSIAVGDLTGEVKAATAAGGLSFSRVRGPLDGKTSAGAIRVTECEGEQQVKTSGGGIEVSGGSGSFDGKTSGGQVSVKDFKGAVQVKTAGGGITIENVAGKVDGKTSGGAIAARFASAPSDEVDLVTSGGGVTLRVPENSAFDLDASTVAGGVTSELSVDGAANRPGKGPRNQLKGQVNGGGKAVVLRSSGGGIQVRKL
jgi:DUF4097 and DUF4098 domain-containing protein YvlB